MGSARLGMVTDALSQGLGLFAGKKSDEEKERVERQWQEALEKQREEFSVARDKAQNKLFDERAATKETADAERFTTGQENQTERARLANVRVTEEGRLNREQRQTFEKEKRTDTAEESLFKRIDAARARAADEIEDAKKMLDETAEERIMASFSQERDEMVVGHVMRLNKRGDLGYEMDSPGAFEAKLIELGVGADSATRHTNNLAPLLWPQQPTGTPLRVGEPGGPVAGYTGSTPYSGGTPPPQDLIPAGDNPAVAVETPPAAIQPQAAAGSKPADAAAAMLNGTQTTQQRPGYYNPDQRGSMVNDVLIPAGKGIKDWLESGQLQGNENPYMMMGQRPK